MKKYAIDLDITKCISCGACSIACMDQNDFQVKEGQRPFRNVFDLEMEQKGEVKYSHLSLACMHCSDAALLNRLPKQPVCAKIRRSNLNSFTIPLTVSAVTDALCMSLWIPIPLGKWQDD